VFRQPAVEHEIAKLLASLLVFPDRCHLVGVYALGKCQRLMMELRRAGYSKPFYVHGALVKLCELFVHHGFDLGEVIPIAQADKMRLAGEIVFCPPSALADRWSRSLPNVLTSMASGWMQIRARAKQRMVELPLVISDHADWDELNDTIARVGAPEIWITHGREDALSYEAERRGIRARPLSLIGFEDEGEE
jgi:putative mRNA 3-end processing factor